ncbi:hypothetical protein GW17_00022522 [Ensete ventricosum]|nr:hypothetical protein GW17_00022522 [Ensete ventricosum]
MIGQSQVQASGRGSDNAVGNSPGVRRELTEGIGSLSGWCKGVRRKRTKTRRKTVGGSIEKIAKNIPRDCQRKTVRLFAGNAVGCRIAGVRS